MDRDRKALVVGYGNRLRSDDALGWHVIERLGTDPRVAGTELLWRHQLTPELCVDMAEASLVVLVDAAANIAPAQIEVREVEAAPTTVALMTHHIDPGNLAAMALELQGRVPPVYLVSVGVVSLSEGDGLSPEVERAISAVLDVVAGLVAGRGVA